MDSDPDHAISREPSFSPSLPASPHGAGLTRGPGGWGGPSEPGQVEPGVGGGGGGAEGAREGRDTEMEGAGQPGGSDGEEGGEEGHEPFSLSDGLLKLPLLRSTSHAPLGGMRHGGKTASASAGRSSSFAFRPMGQVAEAAFVADAQVLSQAHALHLPPLPQREASGGGGGGGSSSGGRSSSGRPHSASVVSLPSIPTAGDGEGHAGGSSRSGDSKASAAGTVSPRSSTRFLTPMGQPPSRRSADNADLATAVALQPPLQPHQDGEESLFALPVDEDGGSGSTPALQRMGSADLSGGSRPASRGGSLSSRFSRSSSQVMQQQQPLQSLRPGSAAEVSLPAVTVLAAATGTVSERQQAASAAKAGEARAGAAAGEFEEVEGEAGEAPSSPAAYTTLTLTATSAVEPGTLPVLLNPVLTSGIGYTVVRSSSVPMPDELDRAQVRGHAVLRDDSWCDPRP